MPRREKVLATLLALALVISIGHLLFTKIRLPIMHEKGVFTEGFAGSIKNINPLFVDFNETDRDIAELVFSGLIRYDPVKKNFFPDLADSYEKSKDSLTYTFTLRPDALWHDLTPVTAEDVFFTFHEVIQDPGFRNPILKNAFAGITVAPKDSKTISFTLPKPNSYFISNLTVGILPKHMLNNASIAGLDKSPFGQSPIGSGPYKVDSLNLSPDGDYIDLMAFANYYGPKPAVPRIRLFTFPDEKSLLRDYNSIHALSKLNSAGNAVKIISANQKFTVYPYTLNQFTALFINTDHPVLKEKKVRQALTLALNKKELVFPDEKRVDVIDLQDRGGEPAFQQNLEEAKKILEGEKLTFTLVAPQKTSSEFLEKIKEQLQKAGVQIDIQKAESEDFSALAGERRYGMLLIKQNLGYNRDVYPLFHSSQANATGLNFSNFKSFRTDGLTEAIRKEQNPADKEKLLAELSKVIAEETPVIFLSTPVYSYALPKDMQKFPTDSLDFHSDRLSILPYLSTLTP